MGDDLDGPNIEFAAFRQQFANGPQRRRLGYGLSHEDALRVLDDPERLADEYGKAKADMSPELVEVGFAPVVNWNAFAH